jgi:hypothetical protein
VRVCVRVRNCMRENLYVFMCVRERERDRESVVCMSVVHVDNKFLLDCKLGVLASPSKFQRNFDSKVFSTLSCCASAEVNNLHERQSYVLKNSACADSFHPNQ